MMMHVPNAGDNDETYGNENNIILPAQTAQPSGRPRKRRIPSVGENIVKNGKEVGNVEWLI